MRYLLGVTRAPLDGMGLPQRFVAKAFLLFLLPFIKIEIDKSLSLHGQSIFVFNHNNAFETIAVAVFLLYKRRGEKVRFVVDWVYGYLPVIGWLIRQVDPILVYNKRAKIPFFDRLRPAEKTNIWEECIAAVEKGESIAIFPEGTRNPDPFSLLAGKIGVARIALKSGVPVLPIGIDFPCRIKNGRIPYFGRMIFRIGEKKSFGDTIEQVSKIENSQDLSLQQKQKLLLYFDKSVLHNIMRELERLSGKRYHFPPPRDPFVGGFSFASETRSSGHIHPATAMT